MGKRRDGREAALQYLYQLEQNGRDLKCTPLDFWRLRSAPGANLPPEKMQAFTAELVQGVSEKLPEIDAKIQQFSVNYEVGRMAAVDRNVLRIAVFEMLFCPGVPPVVSINEAIEIAKRFGTEESGRFVNGILDKVRGELPRSAREGQREGTPAPGTSLRHEEA